MAKLSEIPLERLLSLSWEEKWEICCGGVRDEDESAEVALLLGSLPERAVERALAAAKLYHAGRAGLIIPTGGPLWEYEGRHLTEAQIMQRVLLTEGVPPSAIVPEDEARTTEENMIYGALQMYRTFQRIPDSVIIVTSVTHMKRSIALARALLPRKIRVSMYPAYPLTDHETWMRQEENRKHLDSSLRFHKALVDRGDVEDITIAARSTPSTSS